MNISGPYINIFGNIVSGWLLEFCLFLLSNYFNVLSPQVTGFVIDLCKGPWSYQATNKGKQLLIMTPWSANSLKE
jgi:hypothetical protein